MSLNIHQRCKERLIEVIAEHLGNVLVKNKIFIERASCIGLLAAESILPHSGDIKETLKDSIGEIPIFDFVYESLSRELAENIVYDSTLPLVKLTDIEGYQDVVEIATRLVHEFDSLPWQYTFSIEMNSDMAKLLHENIGEYEVSENMTIRKSDADFSSTYPPMSGIEERDKSISNRGLGLLSLFTEHSWNDSGAFLQIKNNGFVGQYGSAETHTQVIEKLKSFCGLGIALRLFKINPTYRSTPTKAKFYIHKAVHDNWIILDKHELDYDISDTFHDLVIHDLDGVLDTQEKKTSRVNRRLREIGTVFSCGNLSKTHKLLLACQWLFESYSGKNELLSFVQTTIVIEILLGDKASSEQVGLGALLRNRCAYLIGVSQTQRNEILDDFQKIYDVRSKIVHGGKSRLNYIERGLLAKLQWMCRRVIQEEVKLLSEDEKKDT
ncbi:hypothetical protein VIOR3934_08376 [Vibrio orientalis CIP 102891 = ATCC 33934]|uniref:Uncharacterized protein n=1 Tax=Vibrio orientalis CIP 102891 = ATCC 33934 TaxID=675816 RepID=C9QFM5_VIBOR|nr:HEPN domain-containing protein [Vibrio orientalis]EEX94061.1 hypothetical protein VIA_001219 [Vibrio orientalis CIP 102891 = ATCC 33934]EGU52796.1 hypothetical protein VIOR3934_08376 [Vibrio orientalis CIP 102891 = ATCC 33934]